MIGKNIGEGTFGKVKAGTHNVTGEKVSDACSLELAENWAVTESVLFSAAGRHCEPAAILNGI